MDSLGVFALLFFFVVLLGFFLHGNTKGGPGYDFHDLLVHWFDLPNGALSAEKAANFSISSNLLRHQKEEAVVVNRKAGDGWNGPDFCRVASRWRVDFILDFFYSPSTEWRRVLFYRLVQLYAEQDVKYFEGNASVCRNPLSRFPGNPRDPQIRDLSLLADG